MDGKEMTVDVADYPELEGVKEGSPFQMRASGTIGSVQNGQVSLQMSECQIETEGQADKAMKEMSEQSEPAQASDSGESDF